MRGFWEIVIDLLPITFRSVSAVGLERPRGLEAKTHEAEAKTHEAEAEAEATTHEAEAEARFFGLEAEARPRGLTSLLLPPKTENSHYSLRSNSVQFMIPLIQNNNLLKSFIFRSIKDQNSQKANSIRT